MRRIFFDEEGDPREWAFVSATFLFTPIAMYLLFMLGVPVVYYADKWGTEWHDYWFPPTPPKTAPEAQSR